MFSVTPGQAGIKILRKYVSSSSSLSRHYWVKSLRKVALSLYKNSFYSQTIFLVYLSVGVWILSDLRWNSQIPPSLQLGPEENCKVGFHENLAMVGSEESNILYFVSNNVWSDLWVTLLLLRKPKHTFYDLSSYAREFYDYELSTKKTHSWSCGYVCDYLKLDTFQPIRGPLAVWPIKSFTCDITGS